MPGAGGAISSSGAGWRTQRPGRERLGTSPCCRASVCIDWPARCPFSERGRTIVPADAAERYGHPSKLTVAAMDAWSRLGDGLRQARVRERWIDSLSKCSGAGASDRRPSPARGLGEVDHGVEILAERRRAYA